MHVIHQILPSPDATHELYNSTSLPTFQTSIHFPSTKLALKKVFSREKYHLRQFICKNKTSDFKNKF